MLFLHNLLFCYLRTKERFFINTIKIALLCGIGTWIIGCKGAHAGTSGLIYGYYGFLLMFAWLKKTTALQIVASFNSFALASSLAYQMIINGVTAFSWESHLCGALAGVYTAYIHYHKTTTSSPHENVSA